jgi:hypothetical protein
MTKRWMWACSIGLVVACGSSPTSSGVDGTKKLATLSTSEQADVCAYLTELRGAPRTVHCGDGSSVELADFSDCSLAGVNATCEATVADIEDCFERLNDDPCSLGLVECAPVFACSIDIAPDRP